MYNKVSTNMNFVEREKEIEKLNPGYKVVGFKATRNKWTGMPYIHVMMRKIN